MENKIFNFLVTYEFGRWDASHYKFDFSRVFIWTSDDISKKFESFTQQNIEELMTFPTLFAYEKQHKSDAQIGYIKHIKPVGKSVNIEYAIDPSFPKIPVDILEKLKFKLDIDPMEFNTTHWAVKERNLLKVLSEVGLIQQKLQVNDKTRPIENIKFKVAFSFPGEKRKYVSEVVKELKLKINSKEIFYDSDFNAQLARPNLDTLLQKIYYENSELIVVFLCSEYEEKQWCGLEWRAIRNFIKEKKDQKVMLMRFDDSNVLGTFSIDGYIDLRKITPKQAANLIIERLEVN